MVDENSGEGEHVALLLRNWYKNAHMSNLHLHWRREVSESRWCIGRVLLSYSLGSKGQITHRVGYMRLFSSIFFSCSLIPGDTADSILDLSLT